MCIQLFYLCVLAWFMCSVVCLVMMRWTGGVWKFDDKFISFEYETSSKNLLNLLLS